MNKIRAGGVVLLALCFYNMFETLTNKTKKLKLPTVKEIFRELFLDKDFIDYIIELNTIDQLYNRGQDSTGDSIGEYETATIYGTSKFKGKLEKGQPIDRVTLKDTGAFYESFGQTTDEEVIKIMKNQVSRR